MDKTHPSSLAQAELSAYRDVVKKYLPAVLVKCTKYTNNKQSAEIIAFFAFSGVYRLKTQLDGTNKIPVVLDSMLSVVGPDYADKNGKPAGDKLFKREELLREAKKLAELDTEECMLRMNDKADDFERGWLEKIADGVMDHLERKGHGLTRQTDRRTGAD